jgi:hypothetical protein
MIVGDMDSVSDRALTCGAEIVVHAYRDGAPRPGAVRDLGVEPVVFPATGTSEDVAMLLADDKGASLIVAVGTHATLMEFLDKGAPGWPARSSPGCGSAASWSNAKGRSPGSTGTESATSSSASCCWRGCSHWRWHSPRPHRVGPPYSTARGQDRRTFLCVDPWLVRVDAPPESLATGAGPWGGPGPA